MKVTVCELPNEPGHLEKAWEQLVEHVQANGSEFVLLPEMPFYPWLAHTREAVAGRWAQAVQAHETWISRLEELAPATVASTRPVVLNGKRQNAGYIWEPGRGARTVHTKYYLPDEPGFWEASWYERGDGNFSLENTSKGKAGFLICTEIWFNFRARAYAKQGMQLLLCPRATPNPTAPKWVAGGQAAAVVSGAFCLSSNLAGTTSEGGDYAGVGWVIEPGEGKVLGLTSQEKPFLTLEIDLAEADKAKKTYPRYVLD
jgi:N-carbamoylputrescine amidase